MVITVTTCCPCPEMILQKHPSTSSTQDLRHAKEDLQTRVGGLSHLPVADGHSSLERCFWPSFPVGILVANQTNTNNPKGNSSTQHSLFFGRIPIYLQRCLWPISIISIWFWYALITNRLLKSISMLTCSEQQKPNIPKLASFFSGTSGRKKLWQTRLDPFTRFTGPYNRYKQSHGAPINGRK